MSRQQMLSVGGQRSIVGRVMTLLIVLGLIAWFIKSPVEAAHGVKTVWNWFMGAVDSVVTFIDSVTG